MVDRFRTNRRQIRALLSCLFLVLGAQDCPGSKEHFVVEDFQLEKCPADDFALPSIADRDTFRITPVGTGSWCPGFSGYALFENQVERMRLTARLTRPHPCHVQVAYSFRPSENKRTQIGDKGFEWGETAARLLMANEVARASWTRTIHEFRSYETLRNWCGLSPR